MYIQLSGNPAITILYGFGHKVNAQKLNPI